MIGGLLSLIGDLQSSCLLLASDLLLSILSSTGGSFGGLPSAATFDLSSTSAPLASNIRATIKNNAMRTTGVLSLCPAVGSDSERKYLAALTGTEEKEGEVAAEVAKEEEFAIAREDSAKEVMVVAKEEEVAAEVAKEEFAIAREDSAKEEFAAVKRVGIEFEAVTVAKQVGIRVHFDPSTNFRQKVFKNSPVPCLYTFVKSAIQTTKTSRIVPTGPNQGCSSSQTAAPSRIPAPLFIFPKLSDIRQAEDASVQLTQPIADPRLNLTKHRKCQVETYQKRQCCGSLTMEEEEEKEEEEKRRCKENCRCHCGGGQDQEKRRCRCGGNRGHGGRLCNDWDPPKTPTEKETD